MSNYFTALLLPCSIISVCLSSLVILTVIVFPEMMERRIFNQIVVLISVADIFGNWPYLVIDYPRNGSIICALESFCNLFFFPVSWILTTMLTKLFRDVLILGRVTLTRWFVFGVSCCFPLLVTLLYLAFDVNSFVSSDDERESSCTYAGVLKTYHVITYNILLLLCLAIMSVLLLQVLNYEIAHQDRASKKVYRLVKSIVILYPFALLICWIPHAVCLFIETCYYSEPLTVQLDTLKVLHGGVVALIFFGVSGEARTRWYKLLFSRKQNSSLLDSSLVLSDSDLVGVDMLPDDEDLVAGMRAEEMSVEHFDSAKSGVRLSDIGMDGVGDLNSVFTSGHMHSDSANGINDLGL